MDPNETLRMALKALCAARSAAGLGEDYLLAQCHDAACEATANLSHWIANGGFDPDWKGIVFDILSAELPPHPDDPA